MTRYTILSGRLSELGPYDVSKCTAANHVAPRAGPVISVLLGLAANSLGSGAKKRAKQKWDWVISKSTVSNPPKRLGAAFP